MDELSHYVFEPLWTEGEFVLSRSVWEAALAPLLVMAPVLAQPTPESLQRLTHAYALREALEPAWAACPLALVRHQGRPTLVLADPGGEVLARLVGQPWEVTPFLRVAIGLAVALGRLHAHGLMHKDVKPAHVLVHTATGDVWLTGFGIASRLPRERQAPAPPEVIAGTLAYMAPEQTGRMHRSIDARSDLYALGVTLYEMLTGSLPFTAAAPMEWVHCHIARQPLRPSERVPGIPGPLDAMVMKLLAKTPEDRYQTAAGVEADLRRCLATWEARGRITPFPLGRRDAPDRLLLPETLYGREREIALLLAAYDRVVAHGTPELVLVSGAAGIGKSAVVHELHQALVPPRGLFASGKCDQYTRDIPYATLAQAFRSLLMQLLSQSDADLDTWREALRQALGAHGHLLVTLMPELALVIGPQPPVPDLPPQEAQQRFQRVFRRFLSVFVRPEHPLVLFLDDLQWLDAATLDLLQHVLTEPEVRHLLLVGAYRDNEVSPAHPLRQAREVLHTAKAAVHEIALRPLGRADVCRLVADTLHCAPSRARPLAQLVHAKTAGNPFFAIQFLTALTDEGLLTFDPGATVWIWDLARIRAMGYTDNVVDLLVGRLSRLPTATQEALTRLACLGNRAETATLGLVQQTAEDEIHAALWEAVRAGLVVRLDNAYSFLHDRVQEAAYALIPDGDRAQVHLQIGRRLAARTAPEELGETVFEVLHQLNRGAALITSPEEREQAAVLNLTAGRRAKAATAYAAALTYLAAGGALLAEDGWERCFALAFALELHRAECEFLTGDLAAADTRLTMLSDRATHLVDRAAVARLRMALSTTLGRSDRAVEICLAYLRDAGIAWSPHPADEEVQQEYEHMVQQLGSRPIEALIDLPPMRDPDWRTTMDVLQEVMAPAWYTDKNLLGLVLLRMTNLSLEYGHSDASCHAYVCLNLVLGPRFGDYRAAFRFGQLSFDLVEQRGLDRFKARVYHVFGSGVMPWTRPLHASRALLQRGFDVALETGDLAFAAYICTCMITNLFASGDPLGDVQREAENGLAFAQKARFGLVVTMIAGQLSLIRVLRSLPPDFVSCNEAGPDAGQFEPPLEGNPQRTLPACLYWIYKLQAHFFAADYTAAIEAAAKAQRLLWITEVLLEIADYHFYGALARAASYDAAPADERLHHLAAIVAHQKQLALWAENCPENFRDRASLVAAEIARIDGRDLEAMRLYEEAMQLARTHGFLQHEGLANERAAQFYAARGFETSAHASLRHARDCYRRWGAEGKVRQLDQTHPHLREGPVPQRPTTTIEAPVEHLDLATVVNISQAVSGEIVLEQLLNTLMTLAVEHAGAERGLLLLPHADALWIEAEATTGRDAVTVRLRHAVVSGVELPVSVLHYVLRTQEPVLLDDAAAPGPFAADAYLRQTSARSVLCLPLVKQARLIGVLYLENRLTSHVFTAARSAVLTLLASQAAIALENARLYADVQHENRARTAAEEALRASEERYRTIVEAQTDLICRYRPDTTLTFVNEAYCRYFDRTREELLGTSFLLLLPEDTRQASLAHIRSLCDHPRVARYEHAVIGANGDIRWQQWVDSMILDAHGHLLEVQAVARDITESKRAEQRLMAQYTVTQILAEAATLSEATPKILQAVCECLGWDLGALWSLDRQAGVLRCVELWQKAAVAAPHFVATSRTSTFFPGSGLPGRVWASRAPVSTPDVLQDAQFLRAPIAAREGLHTACGFPILLGGEVLGVMEFFSRERRQPDQALLPMMATIGSQIGQFIERKRAEDALRASEASLAEGQQISHTGNWRWNVRPGDVRGSAEHARIFGFDPAAGPRSHLCYRERVHPDDRPALVHVLDSAIRDQCAFQHEYRIVLPDGVVKHVQLAGRPDSDASGALEFAGTIMDITERKRAEEALHNAQVELARMARLTMMGELTASITHEINQPLGAVVNNASACVRWLAAQNLEEAQRSAALVVADGHRAADIIGRIRALAQKAPPHKDWLDLNATIRDVLALARSEVHRHGVVVETHLAAEVPPILGDRIQLQQVLLNLVMNAIEAMSGVGAGPRVLRVSAEPVATTDVLIAVRDAGPGLDLQSLDRLFDAFYTTKPQGLGLGLAISRRIIEAHGGRLWATPNPGPGATFQLTLPAGGEQVS